MTDSILEPYSTMPPLLTALHLLPFALLLLLIAVCPLVPALARRWHPLRHKLVASLALGLCGSAFYIGTTGDWHRVAEAMLEFAAFIAMLASLYIVSGGIYVTGAFAGFPWVNTLFLALGAVLANVLGTTGASMLLLRPLLRANQLRGNKAHIVIFFIFIVGNSGGLLTPLGGPPLYLGFLRGVPFLWTLSLFKPWLLVNGALLLIFHILDERHFTREDLAAKEDLLKQMKAGEKRLHVRGKRNLIFLLLILMVLGGVRDKLWQVAALALIAWTSYRRTPKDLLIHNEFSFGPIKEVAVLFAGIFGAMVPALAVLEARAGSLGIHEPWQYFWASGWLSSVLDNGPTYLCFATLAAAQSGVPAGGLQGLAQHSPRLLEALSCGSVMMGALTYIGNGPNLMVKAIAEHQGVKMPGFGGYMRWSYLILLPVFVVVTCFFML